MLIQTHPLIDETSCVNEIQKHESDMGRLVSKSFWYGVQVGALGVIIVGFLIYFIF